MSRLLWVLLAAIALGLIVLIARHNAGTVFGLESEAFARTLALGTIAAFIGAGIFRSGYAFSYLAKAAFFWLLIIAALVGGYQYRYELQDVANRMTAGLIPGSPLSIKDADGRVSVMLERLRNGHFEVKAEFDGAAVVAMIDTGATSTVLTYQDAERAGLNPDGLDFTVPVMTANGTAKAARAVIDELRIGAIVRRRVPVLVTEAGRLDRSLLGMNVIGTLSGFDMRGDRLILRD